MNPAIKSHFLRWLPVSEFDMDLYSNIWIMIILINISSYMNIVVFHRLSHDLLSLQENIDAFTIFNLNLAQENKNHFLKKSQP